MANELLMQALEECKARSFQNQEVEQKRMEHAVSLCPEIQVLDEERRNGILEGLKLAIEGIKPEGIQERTRAINNRIIALLASVKLPEDYLEPVFQCQACQDSGYVGTAPKELCGCVNTRYLELISGSNSMVNQPSFEQFDLNVFPENEVGESGISQRQLMRAIRRHGERFADTLPRETINLVLYGPSGLGKTYLLKSIAKRVNERGVHALVLNANALLNHIRQAYFSRDEETSQPYYDVPLLLIDDLGTEPLWENITLEQIFALLEHRIQHGLHTVISTNLTMDEIRSRYTQRIYSRLVDQKNSLVLQFQGQDVRLIPRL